MTGTCASKKEVRGCAGKKGHIHESNGESLKHLMQCDDIIILHFEKWYEKIREMRCK